MNSVDPAPQSAEPSTVPVSFSQAKSKRRGSPRSTQPLARAKLVHTSHGGRRIEVFVTAPLMQKLRWKAGGRVQAGFRVDGAAMLVRLTPSHSGPALAPTTRKTTTCRVHVCGDFIAPSACAPIRVVPYQIIGGTLDLTLPRAWGAAA